MLIHAARKTLNLEGVVTLKVYESPKAEVIKFGNNRIDTTGSRCDCYTEKWNYTKFDMVNTPIDEWPDDGCTWETKNFIEVGDATIL